MPDALLPDPVYVYGLIIFPTYFTLQIFINIQTRQYRSPPCPACLAKRRLFGGVARRRLPWPMEES